VPGNSFYDYIAPHSHLKVPMNIESTVMDTSISQRDASSLERTAKWARFLGIVGFVLVGVMVLFSLFIGAMISWFMGLQQSMMAMSGMQGSQPELPSEVLGFVGAIYTVIFLLSALLYFFPSLYLYRFGLRTLHSLKGPFNADLFHSALDAQRRLFTFMGVLTIVLLAFYGFGFVVFLLGALFSSML
jgi:hypothetical protein